MAESIRAADLIERLQRNEGVIKRQFEGLSHEDSLLQPESRGNCGNWILGHIINGRNNCLGRLGEEPIWDEEASALYRTESSTITGPDSPHLPLEKLLDDLKRAGEKIVARLQTISDDELNKPATDNRTLWQSVSFQIWHEAYHTGQFEYLRQLTGVNDKVI